MELSDEEVQILVDLMTKEDTCDVAKLNLEESQALRYKLIIHYFFGNGIDALDTNVCTFA